MQIAGYSYTWGPITGPREFEHAEVIRWFRDQGLTSIELYDPWIKDKTVDEVKVIIDALAEAEVRVCVCDVECDVISRDPDARKIGTERFHQRLAVAKNLGAANVLILQGIPGPDSGLHADEIYEWLNTAIQETLPVVKELGLTLMLANLGFRGDIYGQSDWVAQTCKTFEPDLKTVYDVGNYVMAGDDPIRALDKVSPYIGHVHLKDWVILPQERVGASWIGCDNQWFQACRFGEGIVPLVDAVNRLKQLEYDGLVSPEYEGPDDPFEVMEQCIAYSRKLVA